MKAYLFLVIGVLWFIFAIVIRRTGFSFYWPKDALDPATGAMIFQVMLALLLYGWVGPTALGIWLLWTKK
jgi:hypothetical protein